MNIYISSCSHCNLNNNQCFLQTKWWYAVSSGTKRLMDRSQDTVVDYFLLPQFPLL